MMKSGSIGVFDNLKNEIQLIFVNIQLSSNINVVVYNLCIIIEAVQLFSYVFNEIYLCDKNIYTREIFSSVFTYFRGLSSISEEGNYYSSLGIIYGMIILITVLEIILGILGKIKRSSIISNLRLVLNYIVGYSIAFFEKILLLPFMLYTFQTFICSSRRLNAVEEVVAFGISEKNCWNSTQIVFIIFAFLAILGMIIILTESFLFYSSNCYISKLPWADQQLLVRLLVVLQKMIISIFLIFDPEFDQIEVALLILHSDIIQFYQ